MALSRRIKIGDWVLEPARNRINGPSGSIVLAPLAARVLEYLAEHRDSVVSADELVEQLWQRRMVGDSPVYRVIADLRRALQDDAKQPRYVETVRKRGYRLLAPVVWMDADAGSVTTAETAPETSFFSELKRRKVIRSGVRLIIVVLAAGVLFLLIDKFLLQTPSVPLPHTTALVSTNSIAVMPFVALSGSPDDAYAADGIAEVLIHQLAQVEGLKVTARTSSFALDGRGLDASEIGRRLGVAAILEGSVQRSDGQFRITAQLIDVSDGTHYWSELFDPEDTDIFAIQDEIARRVIAALPDSLRSVQANPEPGGVGTSNGEAYDEYLRGLQQLRIGSVESLPRAIEHFLRAIELDEDYNESRLKLLEAYTAQNYIFQIDYAELMVRNQTIPHEILRRDPNSARAMSYLASADFSLHFPTGSGDAERLWNRALEIAPSDPVILSAYAYYLAWNDRPDEAVASLDKALDRDPYDPRLLASAARHGNHAYAETLREMNPDNPLGWSIAGELYIREGNLPRAYESFRIAENMSPRNPEFPAMVAMVLMTVGLIEEAAEAVKRAESKGPGHSTSIAARIALTYRKQGLDAAGELALNALRNQVPARQFSVIVTQLLALRYALRTGQPLEFIDALAQWRDTPGSGGRVDMRIADFHAPTTFSWRLLTIPAFRAAGETDVADALLERAREYFHDASDVLRHHETEYYLQLMEHDVEGALNTLEAILELPRSGFLRNSSANPSEYRWWLEFEGELAAPLVENSRYHAILANREEHIEHEREEILELIARAANQLE